MPGQNLFGTPVMTASSSVGHASDAGRSAGHEGMGRSSESTSAPTSPHLSRPGARGGASYAGPSPSGFSPNLSTRPSRHSLRYETTHQARQPSHDSSSHQHQIQQQQPYTNSRPQHQSRPSITSSNSQHQSNPYLSGQQTGPLGHVAGRQQSFERLGSHYPTAPALYRHQSGQSISSPVGQAPYSASATMSSALPSEWQGSARVPTRSATDPSSPYLVDNAPRSQDSNGHGTPRADSQSVFANQQASTPRASANERSIAPDQGMQQQQQYASGLRIMPPPPIPPLSPSRQLRQSNRGRYQGTPGPLGLATQTSNLAIAGGDAGRRTTNGPNPSRSPTTPTYAAMGEQQQQAQYTRRAVNVPLPPSESSHQGQHPSEAEKREQAAQGDSAVVENVGSDARERSRQESAVTNHKFSSSSQPPVSSGAMCGACGTSVKGQYVRAMGKIYHLECFKCRVSLAVVPLFVGLPIDREISEISEQDCNQVVAAKFFPVDDQDDSYPLCERDYFARLDLICGKCDNALRGAYITACNRKYHVEHFTCSVCPTVFGPQDSYYEHDDKVCKQSETLTDSKVCMLTHLTVFKTAISTTPHDSPPNVSAVRTQS